ncbi:hypothetical protein EYR38_007894 [Pleurotus pulmonarius]|nr:hypothetical protein EYR38_007894 [Pleurotus pulmonarius]
MSQSHWQPDTLSYPSWQTARSSYQKVWKAFWNNKEKGDELTAGKVIDLEPLAHSGLGNTRGYLYIREHDVQVYERLCKRAVDPACGGVVLSGQPGTGKTYSLFFFLLKKLTKGEPVLFSLTGREVLYFSSGGVQSNRDIAPLDLDALDPTHSQDKMDLTWALINGDEGDKLPPPTALFEECIFSVQATSPRPSRYKAWLKQRGGEVWLAAGLPGQFDSEREVSIDKAIYKWGWAPRDIIWYLRNKDRALEGALGRALSSLTSSRLFDQIQDQEGDGHDMLVVSTYQSSSRDPETAVSDLKSSYIARRVRQRLDTSTQHEISKFTSHCRAHRESALMAEWLFDNLVVDILSSGGREDVLSVPISAIRVSPSTCLEDVTLDNTKLYIPSQCDFPLLDAFYLVVDHEARHATVVVLQITIFMTHKGSSRGFAFLERLKGRLEALGDQRLGPVYKRQRLSAWRISFDYRLVVPLPSNDQGNLTFTWSFPDKFPESIEGPVSVQLVSSEIRALIAQEDASYLEEDDA